MTSVIENAFAFALAPIGMALVDPDGRLLRVNDALCRMTGYTADELCARRFDALSSAPDGVAVDLTQILSHLDGRAPIYQVETQFGHARGHAVWVLLSASLVRDADGGVLQVIAQVQDISERKELEGSLERLVDHDFLTGLFNGRRFEEALEEEIRTAARYGGSGAMLLIDLDHFKAVNDGFGHKAGDDLLKVVAAELGSRTRETDLLARLGGDEFGIILRHVNAQQAESVAEAIVAALRRQTATLAEHQIPVTASVGVAMFDHFTPAEILAAADFAMYEAKDAGRNQAAVYRPLPAVRPRPRSRLAEAERIQHALAQDRLELHCQPILDLSTNLVSQYELLVRLRTEQGELLPPSAFLYVAERFGTILSIDAWVVQRAAALAGAEARAGRSITLNVNLSAKSIGEPQLTAVIDGALATEGAAPSCLVFELTETAAIGDIDRAKTFMEEMKFRGFRFALDDFGSGFGSFSYLKHLPFDFFKIDGDFTQGFGSHTIDQLVVEAIVGIAKGMGKQTVAEFVTDQDMVDRLRRGGVDYVQGFHVGVPKPIAEVFASTPRTPAPPCAVGTADDAAWGPESRHMNEHAAPNRRRPMKGRT